MLVDTSEEPLKIALMTETMTLSTFIQTPTRGLAPLDSGDDVLLTRRDGENLRVQRDRDVREREDSVRHAVNVAVGVLEHDKAAAMSAVIREFAWVSILSASEANDFAAEYLTALRASISLGNYAHVNTVVNAWMATAEIKSDPQLLARMEERALDEHQIVARNPRRDRVPE